MIYHVPRCLEALRGMKNKQRCYNGCVFVILFMKDRR